MKRPLDKFWSDQDVLFDYKADLHGTVVLYTSYLCNNKVLYK